VRFTGELQRFIQSKTGESGLYGSASEYIRDLVRRDYEAEEKRKSAWLRQELKPGAAADASEFLELDTDTFLKEARALKATDGTVLHESMDIPSRLREEAEG
jgi:antitoxin ParD1/3/4